MRAFVQAERFVSDLESRKMRPAYVFVGDEAFFRKRFRDAILEHLVPPDLREFSLFEFDLAETDLAEILDRARTPSLMAPFQVFFVRGVKNLFGRGSNEEKLAAIEGYCKNPNPDALLIFVADHISIPADVRKIEMQDRDRYQRIRDTLGQYCGIVALARVEEGEAVRWITDYCAGRGVKIEADGARELVDALGGDMMMISNELEKLILYVGEKKRITYPEPVYTASVQVNREYKTNKLRYAYQSLVTPASVFDYDVEKHTSELLKQTEVPGGYDASRYQSERVWATAKDGVKVPISLVYRKDLKKADGSNPLYVYAYGSYGFVLPVTFGSSRISLLDRGVVMAFAHIRGGGDMGKPWHDAGRLMHKRNTFTDFIAVTRHLLDRGYGDRKRVAIEGGSAGGLLMGAVVNLDPSLFRAVVSHVPFVDVINTMLDASLPLTVPEYEEWGDPKEREAFEYMLGYSPYDNVESKEYPAMLVKTSLYDSQVMYWEPAKYVAKLRRLKTDKNHLLLHTNMTAGHGGASGRYDYLKEIAFDYAFLIRELDVAGH